MGSGAAEVAVAGFAAMGAGTGVVADDVLAGPVYAGNALAKPGRTSARDELERERGAGPDDSTPGVAGVAGAGDTDAMPFVADADFPV